ncbi:hypothetical protein APY94_09675 [Thermococcus celericrescens]|uniref:Uncharacterized protein n=1 Tax=Thermococcus celericrescens TaxID=227598 RepID=A0A117IT48_9EURY|nr:hypothetical protein [Thermococcus celericrescens]KUH32354.1 hypothetical protein APY94_09675 [Thermococcus celericrescens]
MDCMSLLEGVYAGPLNIPEPTTGHLLNMPGHQFVGTRYWRKLPGRATQNLKEISDRSSIEVFEGLLNPEAACAMGGPGSCPDTAEVGFVFTGDRALNRNAPQLIG